MLNPTFSDPAKRSRSDGVRARCRALLATATVSAVLLMLNGCGSTVSATATVQGGSAKAGSTSRSSSDAASTKTSPETVPSVNLTLTSDASLHPLAARYTCDGADGAPPLRWSQVPHGTVETDVFILSALPVNGRFVVAWAVAGLSPHTRELSAGHLPRGAIVGRNSFGQARYSICPASGTTGKYAALVYAVPRHVHVARGFDAEALVEGELVHIARSEGELGLSYTRR